jgi:hypothetical protein
VCVSGQGHEHGTPDGAVVRIALSDNVTTKLFGLSSLLVGGYLAHELASGIVDLVSGRAAITEMLVGTLVLLIVAGAFVGLFDSGDDALRFWRQFSDLIDASRRSTARKSASRSTSPTSRAT